jgi:Flp pilus assembly protein TadB
VATASAQRSESERTGAAGTSTAATTGARLAAVVVVVLPLCVVGIASVRIETSTPMTLWNQSKPMA